MVCWLFYKVLGTDYVRVGIRVSFLDLGFSYYFDYLFFFRFLLRRVLVSGFRTMYIVVKIVIFVFGGGLKFEKTSGVKMYFFVLIVCN